MLLLQRNAICNKREEKETRETTSNLSSFNKEMILLQTAEAYVVNERNNKNIKLKVLFEQDLRKVFCHNVPILDCNCQQFVLKI